MKCPKCGAEVKAKFNFCVVCGSNLEDPSKLNIEQIDKVDRGNYRSESDDGGFTIGSGTFTINDAVPETSSSLFTADELNDSLDEPYIPTLDPEQISMPDTSVPPQPFPQQPQSIYTQPQPQFQNPYVQGMYGQQMAMQGAQPNMTPQLIGYDLNGMPIYAPQAMMTPQLIGYDLNGMPLYAPVGMYPQQMAMQGYPQQNLQGMQPNMNPMQSPQQNLQGMPPNMNAMQSPQQSLQGMQPNMNAMQSPQQSLKGMPPNMNAMQSPQQSLQGMQPNMNAMQSPQPNAAPAGLSKELQEFAVDTEKSAPIENSPKPQVSQTSAISQDLVKELQSLVPDDETLIKEQQAKNRPAAFNDDDDDDDSDFFSQPKRRNDDMSDLSGAGVDFSMLAKPSSKKKSNVNYMNDVPLVNAAELAPNGSDKFTKMFMRSTDVVNADDLEENVRTKSRTTMNVTETANADELESFKRKPSKVTMNVSDSANADELETFKRSHNESLMGDADFAVEAMPKKKAYVDEIDLIELPEYMQARKTPRSPEKEKPSISEL